jgi:hypothetical protein
MRSITAHFAFLIFLFVASSPQVHSQNSPFEYSLEDSVCVGDFEVRKSQDPKTQRWHMEILQGPRVLFRSSNGAKVKEDVLLASFELLNDGKKQLIIEEYTGEAFCCTYNYVLGVGDTIDVLYSSSQYPVGYGMAPEDIDGDGVYELVTTLTRFENFFNMPHEESPTVPVVFRYEPAARRYVVGNRRFSSTILAGVEDEKQRVAELLTSRQSSEGRNGRWRSQFTGSVLNVALAYFYSGEQDRGWAYLMSTYDLDDKDILLANLRHYLLRCPIFRGVYPDPREVLRSGVLSNE